MTDSQKQVLIVDDESGIRSLLKTIVEGMGCIVELAENGHLAFRMATQGDFDLAIMDINMPDWDGLDAIRSLAMVQPNQKIIVLSGHLNAEIQDSLEKSENVVGVFSKPFEIDPLCECITNNLNS